MKLKLTDEMQLEYMMIFNRIGVLSEYDNDRFEDYNSYNGRPPMWNLNPLRTTFRDELESYKIKLENFYGDTDLKEQLNCLNAPKIKWRA